MSNLNLKGIWIPIEILTDKKLSDKEKTNNICNNNLFKQRKSILLSKLSH